MLGSISSDQIIDFCKVIYNGIYSVINLETIATVIIALIGIGLVANFAWYFGSFGFHFICACLEGEDYEQFYGEKRTFKGMLRRSHNYAHHRYVRFARKTMM